MGRFMLIDGDNVAGRGYFVLKDAGLTNPEGRPICMEMSFLKTLIKYLRDYEPTHLCVVFDEGKCTHRETLFDGYKQSRKGDSEEVTDRLEQKRYTDLMCTETLGIKTVTIPNIEADDIIAAMSRKILANGDECYLVSNDHDMYQLLLNSNAVIVKNDILITREDIIEKYDGILPERLTDVWALSGDASDEIPGVPGVGEKTAIRIINEHGDLETALSKEPCLQEHGEMVRIYHQLVTPIEVDIEVDYDGCDLSHLYSDWRGISKVKEYLESNGFTQILKMVDADGVFGEPGQLGLF